MGEEVAVAFEAGCDVEILTWNMVVEVIEDVESSFRADLRWRCCSSEVKDADSSPITMLEIYSSVKSRLCTDKGSYPMQALS